MNSAVPKIIVVADQPVFDAISTCGVPWDPQHPVGAVNQMWDDLSASRLDQNSRALLFSTECGTLQEVATAIAIMAPHAPVAVISSSPEVTTQLRSAIARAQVEHSQPTAPITLVEAPRTARELLDQLRPTWGQVVAWPESYPPVVDQPLQLKSAPVTWQPAPTPPQGPSGYDVTQPIQATQPAPQAAAMPAPQAAPQPVQAGSVSPLDAAAAAMQQNPAAQQPTVAQQPTSSPVPPANPAGGSAFGNSNALDALGSITGQAPHSGQPGAAVTNPVAPSPAPGAVNPEDLLSLPAIQGQLTLTVTSAKGGSGKTTVAACIASMIAKASAAAGQPKKVVLVDMDTRDSQVGSLIGKWMPTALNIRVQPEWNRTAILSHLIHSDELGIDVLLAPVRPRSADNVGPDFYRHVIRSLQRTHDVVVMDTSVNYLDPLISTVCLPEASAILIVTTLAATSVHGMARALREILEPQEKGGMGIPRQRVGIVVNQAVAGVGMDIDQVLQAALKVPVVGAVPLATTDVLSATNSGRLHTLLEHPLLGPAYFQLAQACLPGSPLVHPVNVQAEQGSFAHSGAGQDPGQKRGLFRRTG